MDTEDLTQQSISLHNRLLDGDVTAPAELAELFLPLLTGYLSNRFRNLSNPHAIDTAVIDCVMNYLQRPEQYDSQKATLFNYLKLASRRDLINLLNQEKLPAYSVELDDGEREYSIEKYHERPLEDNILQKHSPTWDLISKLLPKAVDQEILFMMMDGVRETAEYAFILNINNLSRFDQEVIVKRHKDRIKKIILRHIQPDDLKREQ